ncbi:MAG: hypothetical protein JNJ85_08670, partial [Candidatus Kapabacteria bacterium]|nr:hypothetical protein [Candidatus Kapabacteria bacterium]
MFGVLKKIFGTKHDRDAKEMEPTVAEINNIYSSLHALTDEQIREKSDAFRAMIADKKEAYISEREELMAKLLTDEV